VGKVLSAVHSCRVQGDLNPAFRQAGSMCAGAACLSLLFTMWHALTFHTAQFGCCAAVLLPHLYFPFFCGSMACASCMWSSPHC
jgi:hypothetical protein